MLFRSALIAVANPSKTMLNNSDESGHPCLVPDLRGHAFNFFTIENNVFCGLLINDTDKRRCRDVKD